MVDIVDLKGKQFVFIDEISFGFPLDLEGDKNNQRGKRSEEDPGREKEWIRNNLRSPHGSY